MTEKWISIRRQWNDWRIARVKFEDVKKPRWDYLSGGINAMTPQAFIHGYTYCNKIDGEIAHSCMHGEGPHWINVCIVKKDNDKKTWDMLLKIVGPKPGRRR